MLGRQSLAVLVSGGGSNLQALIDAIKKGGINADIKVVISSSAQAYALIRAKQHQIDGYAAPKADFDSAEDRDKYILQILDKYRPDYIIAAGYLGALTPIIINKYRNRIINIHPSLLPKYGGKGMYGLAPHTAAINNGDKVAGATVHFVDEGMDTGAVIAQRSIDILDNETPESLQARVLNHIEHKLLPECVAKLCRGDITVGEDGKVILKQSY